MTTPEAKIELLTIERDLARAERDLAQAESEANKHAWDDSEENYRKLVVVNQTLKHRIDTLENDFRKLQADHRKLLSRLEGSRPPQA